MADQMVHVVLPSGTRFEVIFDGKTKPEKIVQTLAAQKWVYGGYKKTIPVIDESGLVVPFADIASQAWFDDPETVVAVGEVRNGPGGVGFYETLRIKGPGGLNPELPGVVGFRNIGELRAERERILAEQEAAAKTGPEPATPTPVSDKPKTIGDLRAEQAAKEGK